MTISIQAKKFRSPSRRNTEEKKNNFSFVADRIQQQQFLRFRKNFTPLRMLAYQVPHSTMIESIKLKIKKSFITNRWRQPGLQLPLPFHSGDGGLIEKLMVQRKHFLLCDLHKIFTQYSRNHQGVYHAFNDLLIEHGLFDEFSDCMKDPLDLFLSSAVETSKREELPD